MDVIERIKQQIADNQVLLYMKGTPDFPQCGFSARTSQILNACGVNYGHVNVLADPEIRANLPKFSNWPTFPQLFVKGELVGGCDIAVEMFESGELKQLFEEQGITHS
jgi:monothiol glutaredoxin